jgi:hypothetical protein
MQAIGTQVTISNEEFKEAVSGNTDRVTKVLDALSFASKGVKASETSIDNEGRVIITNPAYAKEMKKYLDSKSSEQKLIRQNTHCGFNCP